MQSEAAVANAAVTSGNLIRQSCGQHLGCVRDACRGAAWRAIYIVGVSGIRRVRSFATGVGWTWEIGCTGRHFWKAEGINEKKKKKTRTK